MTPSLHEAFSWLQLLVTVAGLVVCCRYFRLARSMWLVVLGLAGQAGVSVLYRISSLLIRREWFEPNIMDSLFLFVRCGGIVVCTVFLVGLAGVFRELREELNVLYHLTEQGEKAK